MHYSILLFKNINFHCKYYGRFFTSVYLSLKRLSEGIRARLNFVYSAKLSAKSTQRANPSNFYEDTQVLFYNLVFPWLKFKNRIANISELRIIDN